jgi:hypothetical protein
MDKQTVDLVLQLLGDLTGKSQQHEEKLYALERLLDSYPEMRKNYQEQLDYARKSRSSEMNRESAIRGLDNLRAKLLRD